MSDRKRGLHASPRSETARLLADALALNAEQRASPLAAPPELAERTEPEIRQLPSDRVLLHALIGRDEGIAYLCGLLRCDDVRIVTFTDASDAGKTRWLALAVARELADDEQLRNGATDARSPASLRPG